MSYKIKAETLKLINGYAIHIFPRKKTGNHDNKYIKILKNGTVFAKYRLDIFKWEVLHRDVPKNVVNWVEFNSEYILENIDNLKKV